MNRITKTLTLLLLLIASTASAQRVVFLELPNNGGFVGIAYAQNGERTLLGPFATLQVIRFPTDTNPTPPPVTTKVDRVTYVYEKDNTVVPPPVAFALRNLNAQGIVATTFENDTTTGLGNIPAKDAEVVKAAREAGIPCLVVLSKNKVVRVIKDPKTEEQIKEAVK